MLVQLAQDMLVLEGELMDRIVVDRDEFGREVHAGVGRQEGSVLQDCERGAEIEPKGRSGQPEERRLRIGNDVEHTLETLYQGVEIDGLAVGGPHRSGGIVGEFGRQVHDILHGRVGGLSLPFRLVHDVRYHQARLVGFISVPLHREPGDFLAVRAPDRFGIIAAAHRNDRCFTRQDAIDVDFSIGRESIVPAGKFLAGIGDITAVRAPGKVLDAAERAVRELEENVFPAQDIQALLDDAVPQRGDKRVVQVLHPMVPVAVHQVFGGIGVGF